MSAEIEVLDHETGELVPYIPPQPPSTLFGTDDPLEVVERSARIADSLAKVIEKQQLYKMISGRKHVLVEGWTLLGTMLGVFPVCVWTRKLDDGWEARVEARSRDGSVVGAAESQCSRSESTWKSRDDFALRSMAQTRATSKALRQPLGFVMGMAGFDTSPAEEMPATTVTTVTQPRDVTLLTTVRARIAVLGPTDPSWTMDATLGAATRSFGRMVRDLAELSDNELQQILAAMPVTA